MYVRTTTLALILSSLSATGYADVVALTGVGGSASHAYDINNAGYVVGYSGHFDTPRATMWDTDGNAMYLGEIDGFEYSIAYALNNNNEVVGYSEDPDQFGLRSATRWDNGRLTDLGVEMNAIGQSVARDINDSGVIVGAAQITPGIFSKGFVYDPSEGTQVAGTLHMGGSNLGINNLGTIVGHSFFFGDPDRASIGLPDGRGGYITEDLGPSGFEFSIATAINDTGTIVGHTTAGAETGWQAAIFSPDFSDSPDTPFLLGTLDGLATSEANDVNNNGMVVGWSTDSTGTGLDSHAWAWSGGVMYDLNDMLNGDSPFTLLVEATGVNDNGDIVGWGVLQDGSYSAFVIEGFVPAPGAVGLFVATGLIGSRRRRN